MSENQNKMASRIIIYKQDINKNCEFEKEVGIAIKSKETS